MSVLRSVLVGCMLLVATLGVSGCSDQSDQANKLIDQMNSQITQSNTLGARVTQLVDEVNKLDPTTKDVAKAAPLLAEAQTKLEQQKKNTQTVTSLADQIAALDVSSEMKEYVGKVKEIRQAEKQEQSVTGDLLAVLGKLYDPKKAADYSQAELDSLTGQANALISKDSALQSEISAKQGAADQYFKDNLQ